MPHTLALAKAEIVRLGRNKRYFLFTLALPVVMYLIIGKQKATAYGVDFQVFYMISMATLGGFSGALAGNAQRIAQEKKDGWIRQLRLTPLPANGYVVSKVIVSMATTVPSVLHEMREVCRRYFPQLPAVVVQPGVKTGVPIRMDNPKEVGSDRIMNSLAAVHLYGGPAIVVDFGTSTNFDAVSARGEFVGGALAPGIEISVDALSRRAAQLLKVELTRPPRVIGKNTVEALQSGIVYGFAGQVEGIAQRMAAELAPDDPSAVTVIATGGLAALVIGEVPIIDAHEPWLTLIGLRLVFERNTTPEIGVPATDRSR